MQYYYHEHLTDLDDTGFGIIYVDKTKGYTPPHWHKAVELVLFVRGKTTLKFTHSTLVGQPGDLYLINSHDVHETRCTRNAQYLVVHIHPTPMCRYAPNFDQLNFSLLHDPEDVEKRTAFELLKHQMEEILRMIREEPQGYRLECHSRLFAAAAILVRNFSRTLAVDEKQLQRNDMTRLEPILEYIQLHHGEELALDDAAGAMGLNKEYFCRLFKKNMGVSYLQYVNQVRASAVCRELETCDDTIGEIGERHGFTNPKMLNQYFRELYGCTPSEKRKAFREINTENLG